ncbi:cmgc cdk protein kinase [Plasmopara halstedii]|uniref:Cyclin-dependent kinase 2 homolog n=1 Tax=Plasmopara halstedii TaxID=4781 RepID=A0A0N7L868_PLAHL|nr:cmgc cdk protein kinase [Plasmopara halstedii]CEG49035.1 cmgc cdk protein kinase [Plasmopara halstedii]|eukprot:XP_024585404.1 cmgc cdk protein kinase [Plasmopara halstedii]
MDSDLEALIGATESVPNLDIAQLKAYSNMLLLGVLNTRGILHRDLKPNNFLLTKKMNMVSKLTCADGSSDIDQTSEIFAVLGSSNENGWHDAGELPLYLRFQDTNLIPLVKHFPMLSAAVVDLLSQMLELNPKKRISVKMALQHQFFSRGA